MKTPWMEMTVRDFQTALASSSPTPGGGTAAAIALGQASALTVMVCDLTVGKDKWQDGWNVAEEAMVLSAKIMRRAGELADEDSDAFDEVMSSYRLPKDTDEQKNTDTDDQKITNSPELLNKDPCSKCFVSHFPRPNQMACKLSKCRRKKKILEFISSIFLQHFF